MALGPGHTFPEGKPGIHLTALESWLVPAEQAAERRHARGLRSEVLVGMFLSHLRGHLVAQQPQSQAVPGQQSMGAPLPQGAAAPLRRAWNHSSLGRRARSAALATRIFVHQTQTGTNWDKLVPQTVPSLEVLSWMALQATSYSPEQKNEL